MCVCEVSCEDGERSADHKVTFDVTESETSSVYGHEGTGETHITGVLIFINQSRFQLMIRCTGINVCACVCQFQ